MLLAKCFTKRFCDWWNWGLVLFVPALIPLLVFFGRVLIPDSSFDVLNYHLFGGEQLSNSWFKPYAAHEFFPNGLHTYAPIFELPSRFAKHLLGYRFGTIISLFGFLGLCLLTFLLCKRVSQTSCNPIEILLHFLCCLFAATTNEGMFQLATYFVDNLNGFLQILVLSLVLRLVDTRDRSAIRKLLASGIGILLGGMIFGKMTNLSFALICFLTLAWALWWNKKVSYFEVFLVSFFASLIAAPYFIFLTQETGNPVAPYYSGLIRSPYFVPYTFQFNFGAQTLMGKLLYPLTSIAYPLLLGEGQGVYSDTRISYLFLGNLFLLCNLYWKRSEPRTISSTILIVWFFVLYFVWAFQFGYLRYAIGVEILGIVTWYILSREAIQGRAVGPKILVYFGIVVLGFSSWRAVVHNLHRDINWRPPLWNSEQLHQQQLPFVWAEYQTVDRELSQRLTDTEIVLNCKAGNLGLATFFYQLKGKPLLMSKAHFSYGLGTQYFAREQLRRLPKQNTYTYVTILKAGSEAEDCERALKENNVPYELRMNISNILGYEGSQGMTLIFGTLLREDIFDEEGALGS